MRVPLGCVYCGKGATTRDHVIPRCLLEKPYPSDLPTVPSCRACNEGYSKDEEYFLAIMAQSGFVPSLMQKVEAGGQVDRMLERSAALDTHFLMVKRTGEDGRVYITPDEVRIARVTQKVAFGLFINRYRPMKNPALDDFLALKPIHNFDNSNFIVMMAHTERFSPRRWTHVQPLPGPGRRKVQVFDYMFVRNWVWTDFGVLFCIMRFHETIWAAVRCPNPSSRKSHKGRVGAAYAEQELPLFDGKLKMVSGRTNVVVESDLTPYEYLDYSRVVPHPRSPGLSR
jgi:hypothetical protein